MKKVKIYSTSACVYCKMAKDWMEKNGIEYEEYNVGTDAEKRDEMVKKSGQMGVPVFEVGDEMIIGFDRNRLQELLEIR